MPVSVLNSNFGNFNISRYQTQNNQSHAFQSKTKGNSLKIREDVAKKKRCERGAIWVTNGSRHRNGEEFSRPGKSSLLALVILGSLFCFRIFCSFFPYETSVVGVALQPRPYSKAASSRSSSSRRRPSCVVFEILLSALCRVRNRSQPPKRP